ncbi:MULTISPECIES: FAD-dependent oxidoreductase [unclassified Beijerinckia]|uniref:NAD(P)/FAD-dependent oxidoreductase n=1 Tax=unclassified Beijerinckia TaxID=2638183 RepID=UPI00089B2F8F|nr:MULTISPECIES: FAD-dependent oxidoreductase [unclassified Beijerinckia]MDH7797722.1 NADPH-dependent 2,4-dienoyl-CoA reductase/sulfur reductase-like enzyme [Beijerinckia sp. GAS462]SEC96323.1 3-phenylpropionate/trans-cinnamate dioxygenase ferredoxin reductase subunit/anthranilate 1,2-dioxygenase ferredoxin reductase subunit [Beijerinckia sp. 28-YEA-48]
MVQDVRAVVIVGGGQAGAQTAKALREHGYDGALTLIGAEKHLPYERPNLSKACLLDPSAIPPIVIDAAFCQEREIELMTGRQALSIDRARRRLVLDDGSERPYDRLVLATGCAPRQMTLKGLDPERIFYLRTLDDARALQPRLTRGSSMAIVGGGFIGLEVAAGAQSLGCRVTVLETAPILLPRLGSAKASALVLAHHRQAGIDIRLGTRIEYADGSRLVLSNGEAIKADTIVAGIGVIPEAALATKAGLDVDDGILTNAFGETSDSSIFAAGDVTRHFNPLLQRYIRLESWQNANLQADTVARSLLGQRVPYAEVPWLWSDQGDLNLQAAGAPTHVDTTVFRGSEDEGLSIFQFAQGVLVGGITFNRGKDMPVIRRLLRQSTPIVDPAALADDSTPLRNFLRAGASS